MERSLTDKGERHKTIILLNGRPSEGDRPDSSFGAVKPCYFVRNERNKMTEVLLRSPEDPVQVGDHTARPAKKRSHHAMTHGGF